MTEPYVILAVMAKNEKHVIERALVSAEPYLDTIVFSDTGSTDDTVLIVDEFCDDEDIQPELFTDPWENFGANRTKLMRHVSKVAERCPKDAPIWCLLLDADDEIENLDVSKLKDVPADVDALEAECSFGTMLYPQIKLLRITPDHEWYYEGVTHEALQLRGRDAKVAKLEGFQYKIGTDSARRQSGKKTSEDIDLLEASLEKNPDDPRALFYLANCYRDRWYETKNPDDRGKAIDCYAARIEDKGGYDEERYLSVIRAAELYEVEGPYDAAQTLLEAINLRPWRADAYVALAQLYRRLGKMGLAHIFAKMTLSLPLEIKDRLFVDPTLRGWRALEEYAYGCSAIGDWEQQTWALNELHAKAPEQFERIVENCNRITSR